MLWRMPLRRLFGFRLFLVFCNSLFHNHFLFLVTTKRLALSRTLSQFLPSPSILTYITILFTHMYRRDLFLLLGYLPMTCQLIYLWRSFVFLLFLIIAMFWASLFLLDFFLVFSFSLLYFFRYLSVLMGVCWPIWSWDLVLCMAWPEAVSQAKPGPNRPS